MVDKVNGVLEFFRQRDEQSAELLQHGLPAEEVDALHWHWHELGQAVTRLTDRQWEIVAGNQQAPHREPRTAEQAAEELRARTPVSFEGKMHLKDNVSSSAAKPFDQQIRIQGNAERADAAETKRVKTVISRGY